MTTTASPISITDAAATAPTSDPTDDTATPKRRLSLVGLGAAAGAAAASMTVAAVAQGLDVSLEVTGSGDAPAEAIPVGGFATMTLLGAAVGVLLATAVRRWSARPGRRFVQVTVAATIVSFAPSIASAADAGTAMVLCLTHVVAAAIIIPVLAARLAAGEGRR